MTPAALTPVIYVVAALSWVSAITLARLTRQPPRSTVLIERAAVSVLLALFVTIYALVALNVDMGFAIFADPAARIILRLSTILLGLVPVGWLVIYWRRRF